MKHPVTHDDAAPPLEFRNVSMDFEDRRVLTDISFTVTRGQVIVLTGASASGKSVLLRLAVGLLRPTEGRILVAGREIQDLSEEDLLGMRSELMGYVFQENALFTSLTAYDNAAYRLAEHDWPEVETDRAVHEILRFVGLEEAAGKLPEEMSIGMRRRLEIARALIGWPRIMFFDEPTAGLDPVNAKQILNLVIHARDSHDVASLYITKELHEIPYLAHYVAARSTDGELEVVKRSGGEAGGDTRVMLLHEGRIVFFGTPEEFDRGTQREVLEMTHPELIEHPDTTTLADLHEIMHPRGKE